MLRSALVAFVRRLRVFLDTLLVVESPAEAGQAVDEQDTIQMVDLVLQADREKAFRFNRRLLAVGQKGFYGHGLEAVHLNEEIRAAQATFFALRLSLLFYDPGVHELQEGVSLFTAL